VPHRGFLQLWDARRGDTRCAYSVAWVSSVYLQRGSLRSSCGFGVHLGAPSVHARASNPISRHHQLLFPKVCTTETSAFRKLQMFHFLTNNVKVAKITQPFFPSIEKAPFAKKILFIGISNKISLNLCGLIIQCSFYIAC